MHKIHHGILMKTRNPFAKDNTLENSSLAERNGEGSGEGEERKSALDGIDYTQSNRNSFSKLQSSEPNKGMIEAIKRVGSVKELAYLVGVSHVTIHNWLFKELPEKRALEIEEKTGVSFRMLRPDLIVEKEIVKTSASVNHSRKRYE